MEHNISGILTPVFFFKFDEWLKITGSLEATALLSRLQFHCKNSSIKRDGKIWFTRTLDTFSSWLGLGVKKISSLLRLLESCNLITCTHYKYKGIRQTHISVKQCDTGFVHFDNIHQLTNLCGGVKDALILSRLYYFSKKSKIEFNDKRWAARSIEDIATWAHLSKRQVSRILDNLIKKGLLFKRVSHFNGKPLSHFSVNSLLIEKALSKKCGQVDKTALQHVEKTGRCFFGNNQVDKRAVPYNKKINKLKYTNNNTAKDLNSRAGQPVFDRSVSDINFSKKELAYLQGALANLIDRDGVRISNPKELLTQMKYALKQQISKFNLSFFHGVNRLCAIIRSGNWSTPYGFYHHSNEGRVLHQEKANKEKQWKEKKHQECQSGDFAALATACAKKGGDVTDVADNRLDHKITAHRSKPAMITTDRVFINGQHMLKSDAKARLDSINESIGRYLERAKVLPDNLRDVVMGVIRRLRDEAQELECIII